MGQEVPGEFNTGLPTPDDWLGKSSKLEKILGTRGSGIYSKSYCFYLAEFEDRYKTTEKAWKLRFFRIFMNQKSRLRSSGHPVSLIVELPSPTHNCFSCTKTPHWDLITINSASRTSALLSPPPSPYWTVARLPPITGEWHHLFIT